MIDTIVREIANVGFTLLSVVVIAYVYFKWFNTNLFGNFRLDDSDEEDYKNN